MSTQGAHLPGRRGMPLGQSFPGDPSDPTRRGPLSLPGRLAPDAPLGPFVLRTLQLFCLCLNPTVGVEFVDFAAGVVFISA